MSTNRDRECTRIDANESRHRECTRMHANESRHRECTRIHANKSRRRTFAEWWYARGRYIASHLFLIAMACTTLLPFLWMILASFKPLNEITQISLNPWPTVWHPENYTDVLNNKDISFKRYYFNSVFVAAWVT